ncbi:MAG TPA: outer membrane beta-barrel protein [Chitinophagaceae bacterium]|nr:outer membrane beta-barrel protein [Chitinophagaceae bacterium]HNF70898.1 outer membrane beta-barrel protein [Chitinophagaceae bacterium]
MKQFISVLAFLCLATVQPARALPETTGLLHGHVYVTAGYGAPSIIRAYLKYKTTRDQIQVYGFGPAIGKIEYRLGKHWGIGLNGSYSQSKITWQDVGYDTVQQLYRLFEFGIKAYEISGTLRFNYHYMQREKTDFYAGLGMGYGLIHMWSYTLAHTTRFSIVYDFPRPLSLEATAGFRYFPSKRMGIYSEIGLGKSWILFRKYFLPEALIQGGLVIRL